MAFAANPNDSPAAPKQTPAPIRFIEPIEKIPPSNPPKPDTRQQMTARPPIVAAFSDDFDMSVASCDERCEVVLEPSENSKGLIGPNRNLFPFRAHPKAGQSRYLPPLAKAFDSC